MAAVGTLIPADRARVAIAAARVFIEANEANMRAQRARI
jgi:hypothetical protein